MLEMLWGIRVCWGCRGVRCVLRAGRDCRYSGARRGIGGIGRIGGIGAPGGVGVLRGCYGVSGGVKGVHVSGGVLGAGRDSRYSGARRDIGDIRGY